ncbi:MAG: sodium:proton antiporter [Bacteroidales bacterium]|nr:sodium:proton antiporter [Bacteroidales bacterium]MDD6897218.1 SLC13 family permease [Bacteroidales bacterium]
MALIIISILIVGYVLIAMGHVTKMNKAAIAMFAGTVGWVLYICYGTDFVMSQHPREYSDFLSGAAATSANVKQFIAQNIFIKYVGKGAEIVLFLLSTMTIVEILDNNGCFDFLSEWMRTRSSRRLLWTMAGITFLISANLDNLTTTTMMLVIMHKLLPNRRQRMVFGSAIVLAANCGGALTVIGDPNGLLLWTNGAVTATSFSASLALPCLMAWLLPTWWLGRSLPSHVELQSTAMPYRGDDTNLNRWQRLLMLFVGIGGLWFIPTFHNITKLSPFLGALCVLSVLWIVNEVVNRKLMNIDQMIQRPTPRVLQYGIIQLMLFVMGVMLAIGAVRETGIINHIEQFCHANIHNVWIMGVIAGVSSCVIDTFATCMSFFSLHQVIDAQQLRLFSDSDYMSAFVTNGMYWKIIAYCSAMGGNVLLLGSMSGLALMKMEHIHVGWYFKHVGAVAAIGSALGLVLMWIMN